MAKTVPRPANLGHPAVFNPDDTAYLCSDLKILIFLNFGRFAFRYIPTDSGWWYFHGPDDPDSEASIAPIFPDR